MSDAGTAYSYDSNGNRNMTGYSTGMGNELTSDGTYGTEQKNSANLERLVSARRGAVDPGASFQKCATQNPFCSLSRSAVMP